MISRPLPILAAIVLSMATVASSAPAAEPAAQSRLFFPGPEGKLVYRPYNNQGDTIPDFSHCGYGGGGVRIPDVPATRTLRPDPRGSDDTLRIQQALDELAKIAPGRDGFRGALVLVKGRYRIEGSLEISTSGVVLRGEGQGDDGTVLLAAGTRPRPLVRIGGKSGPEEVRGTQQEITSRYVPVGARSFEVTDGSKFRPGDTVIVKRIGNAAWIHEIGMDRITPRPSDPKSTKQWGSFDLGFDRVVTAVRGNRVTVDAPIACAIDARWGGGEIYRYTDPGRIERAGVENLCGVSEFDQHITRADHGQKYFADERHATTLVSFDRVKNAWARNLTARHFFHGVASISGGAKWVTVQDSRSLEPVSEITGGRRYPFNLNGQLCLVQRCYSQHARHAFVVGSRVPGPNVFLDCTSELDHATSEPHHRWSVGGLYDNVRARMAIQDRQYMGSGHGWAGANYVVWNCEGSLVCQKPPTAQNLAIGFVGNKESGAFPRPEGLWESLGRHVQPRSLYLKQLEDRLDAEAVRNISR